MLENGFKEDENLSLAEIWDFCEMHSHNVVVANRKNCFLKLFNSLVIGLIGKTEEDFVDFLKEAIRSINTRGNSEIGYWNAIIDEINLLTREDAIKELVKEKKIYEKINQIKSYIGKLDI